MAASSPSPPDTPLRRLTGVAPVRPTALDAFRPARRTFLAGDRVDMRALARALNVDRATVYRWVGSRGKLLTEVLWSLIAPTLERLRISHTADAAGSSRESSAPLVINATVRSVITNTGMQPFSTARADDLGLGLETRLIALIGQFGDEEVSAGRLRPAVPAGDLPCVVVRIMESYVNLELVTGEHPVAARAGRVISALLPKGADG